MKASTVAVAIVAVAFGHTARGEVAQHRPTDNVLPKVETLPLQKYVAVRMDVSESQLGKAIPAGIGQVAGWLGSHGLQPGGPPFVRYLTIDMPSHLGVEIGFPVAGAIKQSKPLVTGFFPAGRYVTLMYRGRYEGLENATGVVLRWAQKNQIELDRKASKHGEVWGARAEIYLTDPAKESDPDKYMTKLLFRLASGK